MIEIDDLSLNQWYACLKPYQKVVIEQLVSKYGEEKAAEEWLTARGPIQTATFGGSQTNTAEAQNYWSRLKDEFDKLICGHPDYEKEQKKFLAAGKSIGLGSVTALSNWLSPIIGMTPAILVPAIILILHTTSKMGVKAYCSTKHFVTEQFLNN